MAIRFSCSRCQTVLQANDELVGNQVQCSQCGQIMTVPATSDPSAGDRSAPASPRYRDEPPAPQYRDEPPSSRQYREEPEPAYSDAPRRRAGPLVERQPTAAPPSSPAALMMTIGGGFATFYVLVYSVISLLTTFGLACCWPGFIVQCIVAAGGLINGITCMSNNKPAPRWVAIMQIISIINCDIINLVLGIVELTQISDSPQQLR
jgi:hypothetical protein